MTRTSFERAIELLGGKAYHTEDASQFFPVATPCYIDNSISILNSLHIDLVVLRSSDHGVIQTAETADVIPVVNGGSLDDHPTQALADIYTLQRELGGLDGIQIAIIGRLEHRNVSALLKALSMFRDVKVFLIPFSGEVAPDVVAYCAAEGVNLVTTQEVEVLSDVDAVYLNSPRTLAHAQLLKSRGVFDLRIDKKFLSGLKSHCVILDPMQRSGDFYADVQDDRLAVYRQAENALYVRMAVLTQILTHSCGHDN